MAESRRTRLQRWRFNFFPAYRGAGARITYIAADWREVRIKLPLNWLTRNYVGTIYGGSMYGAVDPIYMIMLIRLLGPCITDRFDAPIARITPISRVRSMTLMLIVPISPKPPTKAIRMVITNRRTTRIPN